MAKLAVLAACILLASPLATAFTADGESVGRQLLQAQSGNSTKAGPKTALVLNINTDGMPVYCVNVTKPFVNQTYKASGTNQPSTSVVTDLSKLMCDDYQKAGQQVVDLVKAGKGQEAFQALRVAKCSDQNNVANTITVASIRECVLPLLLLLPPLLSLLLPPLLLLLLLPGSCLDLGALVIKNWYLDLVVLAQNQAKNVSDIEDYVKKAIVDLQSVGIPTCATVLVSDAAGTKVEREEYFTTS
ncbi:hypothetical protein N2152v2_010926 [Parachlorella kessleri]